MSMTSLFSGLTSRLLPGPRGDALESPVRLGRYGEQLVNPTTVTMHNLAEEGTYFVGTNPTAGTAIAFPVLAAFSDTVPFLYVFNGEPTGGVSMYLHYIKAVVTVAAASGTTARSVINLDVGERNLSTDNTVAMAVNSPNSTINAKSKMRVRIQNGATNSAIAASTKNARQVHNGSFGGLTIVGDEFGIVFGSPDIGPYNGLTAAQATNPGRKLSSGPPIVLGPQTCLTMHLWFANNATTGLSAELEMGWWER